MADPMPLLALAEAVTCVDQLQRAIQRLSDLPLDHKKVRQWKKLNSLSDQTPTSALTAALLDSSQARLALKLRKIFADDKDNLVSQIGNFKVDRDFHHILASSATPQGLAAQQGGPGQRLSSKALPLRDQQLAAAAFFHPLVLQKCVPAAHRARYAEHRDDNRKLHALGYQFMGFTTFYILKKQYPHVDYAQLGSYQTSIFTKDYCIQLFLDLRLHQQLLVLLAALNNSNSNSNIDDTVNAPFFAVDTAQPQLAISETFDELERSKIYAETFYSYIGALITQDNLASTASIERWLAFLFANHVDEVVSRGPLASPFAREKAELPESGVVVQSRIAHYKKQLQDKELKLSFRQRSKVRPIKVTCAVGDDDIGTEYGTSVSDAESNCLIRIFTDKSTVDWLVAAYKLEPFPRDSGRHWRPIASTSKKKRKAQHFDLNDLSSSFNESTERQMKFVSLPESSNDILDSDHEYAPGLKEPTGFPPISAAPPTGPSSDARTAYPQYHQTASPPAFSQPQQPLFRYSPQQQSFLDPSVNTVENCPVVNIKARDTLYATLGPARRVPDYHYQRVGNKFHARVYVDKYNLGEGIDNTKKLAGQRAAMVALANKGGLRALGIVTDP